MRTNGIFAGAIMAASSSLVASPVGDIGPKRKAKSNTRAMANVGRNHPDYGLTVAEHEAAKAARLANQDQPQ